MEFSFIIGVIGTWLLIALAKGAEWIGGSEKNRMTDEEILEEEAGNGLRNIYQRNTSFFVVGAKVWAQRFLTPLRPRERPSEKIKDIEDEFECIQKLSNGKNNQPRS